MAPGRRRNYENGVHGRGTLDSELGDVARGRGSLLLVAAHPDDDVIGAGALLARTPAAHVAYLTNGAPRNGVEASAHGFHDPLAYGATRRREAEAALARASIGADRTFVLGIAGEEATFVLAPIVAALAELISMLGPRLVLTHPYEGGHPDHDAAAFAARAALDLAKTRRNRTVLGEFASYHAGAHGSIRRLMFLGHRRCPETLVALGEAAAQSKSEMLACHATQAEVLASFPRDHERFRRAPSYDFTRPPHTGQLLYERDGFGADCGIDGARWRAEAASAIQHLELRFAGAACHRTGDAAAG
jgi:LmbE family N-acetylglucosaminyl deacetylase